MSRQLTYQDDVQQLHLQSLDAKRHSVTNRYSDTVTNRYSDSWLILLMTHSNESLTIPRCKASFCWWVILMLMSHMLLMSHCNDCAHKAHKSMNDIVLRSHSNDALYRVKSVMALCSEVIRIIVLIKLISQWTTLCSEVILMTLCIKWL